MEIKLHKWRLTRVVAILVLGLFVMVQGLVALTGFGFNYPVLYGACRLSDGTVVGGMALMSAVAFVAIGLIVLLFGSEGLKMLRSATLFDRLMQELVTDLTHPESKYAETDSLLGEVTVRPYIQSAENIAKLKVKLITRSKDFDFGITDEERESALTLLENLDKVLRDADKATRDRQSDSL